MTQPSLVTQQFAELLETKGELQRLGTRFDDVLARLYLARAESQTLRRESSQTRARAAELQLHLQQAHDKLALKQAAIHTLLPYYPHPISPELRHQLDC